MYSNKETINVLHRVYIYLMYRRNNYYQMIIKKELKVYSSF